MLGLGYFLHLLCAYVRDAKVNFQVKDILTPGGLPVLFIALHVFLKTQKLYLGENDAEFLKGKRVLIVDDVVSTGESLNALEKLVKLTGAEVVGKAAVLAEGDAKNRKDFVYLGELPLFFK